MADYGIQVFSETTGSTLFDSNDPYIGMSVVESGIINGVGNYDPYNQGGSSVSFNDEDIVLFKPSADVATNVRFLVTGYTKLTTTFPARIYETWFKIDSITGTAPTSLSYVVLRPMNKISGGSDYGLQTLDKVGAYTIRTFDSRTFTTKDEVQIDYVSSSRRDHTYQLGTINNGEWYNTSSLQMISATGVLFRVGYLFSNNTGTYNGSGPFPYNFAGTGIFHYGQASIYSNYERFQSEYYLRGKQVLGN